MPDRAIRPVAPRSRPASLSTTVYRYFFYGWLFRAADRGSLLERAAAVRHNRERARWLPTYLRRWGVVGAGLLIAQRASEDALGSAVLSAAFAVVLVGVAVYLLITTICWSVLVRGRRS